MNNAKVANKPGSGTMSPVVQKPRKINRELAYLNCQTADAKAALARTAFEMGKSVQHSAKAHPLLALGAVAVGGALLGRTLAGNTGADNQTDETSPSFVSDLVNKTIKPVIINLITTLLQTQEPGSSEPTACSPH